jgi:hypothetical protein
VNSWEIWKQLVFGRYSIKQVQRAVQDEEWQRYRKDMKGLSIAVKHLWLWAYLYRKDYSEDAKIRVTNYVYALKRGGLIK